MRVVVLGAGVIGVSTAWYLRRAGHDVVVVDALEQAASSTSFANAGQLSLGYSAPWAAPGIPLKALYWLSQRYAPLKVRWSAIDTHTWGWLKQFYTQCSHSRYYRNKGRMLRLAAFSAECMQELLSEHPIEFSHRAQGTLQLLRTSEQFRAAKRYARMLDRFHQPYQIFSPADCGQKEPALAACQSNLAGGIWMPNDQTGDCHLFTQALAELCKEAGVEFMFGHTVTGFAVEGKQVNSADAGSSTLKADAYVLAAGCGTLALAKQLGLRLPIVPIKGYSLTYDIENESKAPQSTVMDEAYKVAITRLGNQVRVGGIAEIAGLDKRVRERGTAVLKKSVTELFPRAGDVSTATGWAGHRAMTPDGTPILGGTAYQNVFINTGHGTLGWTMSLGSAKYIADIISGKKAAISPVGLSLARFVD